MTAAPHAIAHTINLETTLALSHGPTLLHAVASPQFMLQETPRTEAMTTHLTG